MMCAEVPDWVNALLRFHLTIQGKYFGSSENTPRIPVDLTWFYCPTLQACG